MLPDGVLLLLADLSLAMLRLKPDGYYCQKDKNKLNRHDTGVKACS